MYKAKNKKRIAISLSVVLILAALLCFFACKSQGGGMKQEEIFNNSENLEIPEVTDGPYKSMSVCMTPPKDAKSPEEYSALENIGFMVGKLMQRNQYHVENRAEAKASVGFIKTTQKVFGCKDYKNGILIVSTVSTNSMPLAPSKAVQRYHGNNAIIVRSGPENPTPEDWKGADTEWSSEQPFEILPSDLRSAKYGLCPMEITDYIIREDTVLTKDAKAVAEGDGYVLTVSLSVKEENGMQDSTAYYKKQMVTMGELDEEPVFESVQLTFRFSKDWTVASIQTEEKYASKKGVHAKCIGNNELTFSYDDSDVNVSAFDTYFSKFI